MLFWRWAHVAEAGVGLALVVVTVQAVLLAWHGPVDHSAWRVAVAAVLLAGAWWLVNGAAEGPVLLVVSSSHGLTLADLLGLPALAAGALLLVQLLR